jgi:hypothetical protein
VTLPGVAGLADSIDRCGGARSDVDDRHHHDRDHDRDREEPR